MAKRKRRSFSKEYKAEVVELIRQSGKTVGAVSRELDLTETAVREWVKQAEAEESPEGPRKGADVPRRGLLVSSPSIGGPENPACSS